MNFQFKNWKAFRDQLKSQDIKIATFDFVYEKCEFKIIYPMEQNAFYIAKRGTQTVFVLFLDWYKITDKINKDAYDQLKICKDLPFDLKKPYNPFDFLLALDNHLKENVKFRKTTKTEYFTTTKKAIPDEEKIYFQRWIPHLNDNKNVTEKNLEKVKKILGFHYATFCKENNVSVGFTNIPNDLSFEVIEDPKKVLDEQKTKAL